MINMVRSLAAEFGITIARGVARAIAFARPSIDGKQPGLPDLAQDVVCVRSRRLMDLHDRLGWYEAMLRIQARPSRQAQLLQTIPGVGPVTVSAVAALIGAGRWAETNAVMVYHSVATIRTLRRKPRAPLPAKRIGT